MPDWRQLATRGLIDIPAAIVTAAFRAYLFVIFALSLVAIMTALIWGALGLAGYPLP